MRQRPLNGIILLKSVVTSFCPRVQEVQMLSATSKMLSCKMIQVTFGIISFTDFNKTPDSDFWILKVFYLFFYSGWSFGCFTFRLCTCSLLRSCRSDKLPFCGFKSSFSRIILCFDLTNIVDTLCSTATCSLY